MHEETLTIEFVNAPDKNPDFGSVKAAGKYWGVPANMLSQFQKGQTVTVGYTTTEGRNGKTFYNIKELRSSAAPKPQTNGQPPTHSNGNGKDEKMIAALAVYNHSFPLHAARLDAELDHATMGDFLFQCRLAVDWADKRYKKFWAEKERATAPPPPPPPADMNDEIPF